MIIDLTGLLSPNFTIEQLYNVAATDHLIDGPPLGLKKTIEAIKEMFDTHWKSDTEQYRLNNITATQEFYTRDNVKFYPLIPDINMVEEYRGNVSQDSPADEIPTVVIFDIERDAPANLGNKAFTGKRELVPKLRYMFKVDGLIYPMLAQRKDYLLGFTVYSHSSTYSMVIKESIEHFLKTRKELLHGMGIVKSYIEEARPPYIIDPRTKIIGRRILMFMRIEEWYIGKPEPEITGFDIEWNVRYGLVSDKELL